MPITSVLRVGGPHCAKARGSPRKRLNKEIKRRTDFVSIFPDPAALLRQATCLRIEYHHQRQVANHRCLSEAFMTRSLRQAR